MHEITFSINIGKRSKRSLKSYRSTTAATIRNKQKEELNNNKKFKPLSSTRSLEWSIQNHSIHFYSHIYASCIITCDWWRRCCYTILVTFYNYTFSCFHFRETFSFISETIWKSIRFDISCAIVHSSIHKNTRTVNWNYFDDFWEHNL